MTPSQLSYDIPVSANESFRICCAGKQLNCRGKTELSAFLPPVTDFKIRQQNHFPFIAEMATCAGEMGGWLVDMITGGRGREGRENFSCSIPGVVDEEPAKVSTGKVRVL